MCMFMLLVITVNINLYAAIYLLVNGSKLTIRGIYIRITRRNISNNNNNNCNIKLI